MNERIRQLFEQKTLASLADVDLTTRKEDGKYADVFIEGHWLTFQEGFIAAIEECKKLIAPENERVTYVEEVERAVYVEKINEVFEE